MAKISSPPIRYTGGKWNLAPWIIGHFPPHKCYVEPFCGGASVLLRKNPSESEVINDLNGEVVNFFAVLRSHPDDLIDAIELTPYSRREWEQSLEYSGDPIERARRFYVRVYQSFMSGERSRRPAWRFVVTKSSSSDNLTKRWGKVDHLRACVQRLKTVQIENDTAEAVMDRFDDPNTLFYVDPPYLHSTRTASDDYRFEMTDSDHRSLAQQLNGLQGMVILSGYDSDLYRDLYSGWKTVSTEANTVQGTKRKECLWINPAAQIQRQKLLL